MTYEDGGQGRNVLYMLQRNAVSREILDRVYRERSLRGRLASLPIFDALDEASREKAADYLRDRVDLLSVDPGQPIFRQGRAAIVRGQFGSNGHSFPCHR